MIKIYKDLLLKKLIEVYDQTEGSYNVTKKLELKHQFWDQVYVF